MSQKIKNMTLVSVLTALAIVLSSQMKIPLFGDIKLDLSYCVLTVSIAVCSIPGAVFVGGVSALFGSMMFSAYGISYSWICANIIIAFVGGVIYKYSKDNILTFAAGLLLACALGLLGAKTAIECILYNIPVEIKLAKNAVAFISDLLCMYLGLIVLPYIRKSRYIPKISPENN